MYNYIVVWLKRNTFDRYERILWGRVLKNLYESKHFILFNQEPTEDTNRTEEASDDTTTATSTISGDEPGQDTREDENPDADDQDIVNESDSDDESDEEK